MRGYRVLIIIAVATAFSAGYLSLSLYRAPSYPRDPLREVRMLRESFRRTHSPLAEIDLQALFPHGEAAAFLEPRSAAPQLRRYGFSVLRALYRARETCPAPTFDRGPLRKAAEWEAARCRGELPPDAFFERGPFFHPLGFSYAYLAAKELRASPEWVTAHLDRFHVTELRALGVAVDGPRKLLSEVDGEALAAMGDDAELFLSDEYLFYRQGERTPFTAERGGARRYAIFARDEWDDYWARTPFVVAAAPPGECSIRQGRLCWRIDDKKLLTAYRVPTASLLVLAGTLAVFCMGLALRKFRLQDEEERRKRFALQTLTHELRTPLASLILATDEMVARYDDLPENAQAAMLGICNDVQRLKRLAETSKQYLESGRLLRFDPVPVASVNGYIDSLLEPFAGEVTVSHLRTDRPYLLDHYWVGVCVKNLVDNALKHGRAPVRVALACDRALEIRVEDSGEPPGFGIDTMSVPFFKEARSTGLGLGLTIVRTVLEAMGAELKFAPGPTRFWFVIEEGSLT